MEKTREIAVKDIIAHYERQKEQKPANDRYMEGYMDGYEKGHKDAENSYNRAVSYHLDPNVINDAPIIDESMEDKDAIEVTPKQDYSCLTDLERAIHRGFLCAGVENVPVGIIKDTAQDCLAQIKPAEWSEDWREEDIQTRFAFYTYKDDPSVLYLSNVFVEEASRNHGFGTRILGAAEKVAEVIGATTISLKVKQGSPANAWYRKNGYGYVTFEDGYDWLEKNLEYMKPYKQEWSEEDEALLKEIVSFFKDGTTKLQHDLDLYAGFLENKLKSLRPQPHWKPSEEQMEALMLAIEGKWDAIKPTGYMSRRLEDLYNGIVNTFGVECKLEE